jgi:hypothetical protein
LIEKARNAQEKALNINLDAARYGTFAEIGAGQEVARWFFHVGKASSTVAKSISAYDMAISDSVYGATQHYVSRARLEAMLDREFSQLVEQLDGKLGERSAFFVFADTVATHGSSRSSGGHGWLGVRFQDRPRAKPSEVIIHLEMLDAFAASQQEAVGLAGVNLIYGAFMLHQDPTVLIRSLMDGLDRRRLEIDMIKLSGPVFSGVDNRLMSLQLVELGLTDAALFTANGEVVQPSEILHNRPVLIERGSFRPVTNVTLSMLDAALWQLQQDFARVLEEPVVLLEMTLNNLMSGQTIDHQDFLDRADILGALAKTVMISSYTRFDCVTTYLRQYTQNWIGLVVGVPTLRAIFEEQYYADLQGGILEGLGRLFRGSVKLFAYPTVSAATGKIEAADTIVISPKLKHLYAHLFENGFIEPIRQFSTEQLHVSPGDVLRKIQSGDATWATFVPATAADLIRRRGLFGFRPGSHKQNGGVAASDTSGKAAD